MIGGERHQHRIAVALRAKRGAGRDRRTGIAAHRLEQDVGLDADLGELFLDDETILRVGDDDRPPEHRGIRHPQHRFLEGRARAEQRQELLRPAFARGRPQPRAGAAAHDERNNAV